MNLFIISNNYIIIYLIIYLYQKIISLHLSRTVDTK